MSKTGRYDGEALLIVECAKNLCQHHNKPLVSEKVWKNSLFDIHYDMHTINQTNKPRHMFGILLF